MPYAGRLEDRTSDDTFGIVWTSPTPSAESRFAFTGRDFDPESDLYHYRARYYDPATGQFISTDPIGFEAGDGNIYRYVGNGPIDGTDPSGMQSPGGWTPFGSPPPGYGSPFRSVPWSPEQEADAQRLREEMVGAYWAYKYFIGSKAYPHPISTAKNWLFNSDSWARSESQQYASIIFGNERVKELQRHILNRIAAQIADGRLSGHGESQLKFADGSSVMASFLSRSNLEYSYMATSKNANGSIWYDTQVRWKISDDIDANGYRELKRKGYFSDFNPIRDGVGVVEVCYHIDEMITHSWFPVQFASQMRVRFRPRSTNE